MTVPQPTAHPDSDIVPNRIVFDWRRHAIGPLRPCVVCHRPAFMRNEDNQPCHKVCAEELARRIANIQQQRQVSAA